MKTPLYFAVILFHFSIYSQADVEIKRLGGSGQSNVFVDESGTLSRLFQVDGTMEYAISPLDFNGWNSYVPIRNVNNIREFFAPIHLPDGVWIKNITFWYLDNTPANLSVELFYKGNDAPVIIMTQIVTGTPSAPTAYSVDIGNVPVARIENKNFFYYMRIACIDPDNGTLVQWPNELAFYRATITYAYKL